MGILDWFRKPSLGRGWLPDELDPRDMKLREVAEALGMPGATALPSAVNLRHPAIAARDQDGTEACVGFAWAQGLELAYAERGMLTGDLSPSWIYFLGRASRGRAGLDAGMQLRDAAKAVVRFGCASEESCPFLPRKINLSPTWTAYRNAYDRKGVKGYYRIEAGDTEAVRIALAAGRPVVGGFQVDQSFVNFRGGNVFGQCRGEILGGHAVCLLGYDAQSFTLINSWTERWGDGGYARVSPAFVEHGADLWAIDVHS